MTTSIARAPKATTALILVSTLLLAPLVPSGIAEDPVPTEAAFVDAWLPRLLDEAWWSAYITEPGMIDEGFHDLGQATQMRYVQALAAAAIESNPAFAAEGEPVTSSMPGTSAPTPDRSVLDKALWMAIFAKDQLHDMASEPAEAAPTAHSVASDLDVASARMASPAHLGAAAAPTVKDDPEPSGVADMGLMDVQEQPVNPDLTVDGGLTAGSLPPLSDPVRKRLVKPDLDVPGLLPPAVPDTIAVPDAYEPLAELAPMAEWAVCWIALGWDDPECAPVPETPAYPIDVDGDLVPEVLVEFLLTTNVEGLLAGLDPPQPELLLGVRWTVTRLDDTADPLPLFVYATHGIPPVVPAPLGIDQAVIGGVDGREGSLPRVSTITVAPALDDPLAPGVHVDLHTAGPVASSLRYVGGLLHQEGDILPTGYQTELLASLSMLDPPAHLRTTVLPGSADDNTSRIDIRATSSGPVDLEARVLREYREADETARDQYIVAVPGFDHQAGVTVTRNANGTEISYDADQENEIFYQSLTIPNIHDSDDFVVNTRLHTTALPTNVAVHIAPNQVTYAANGQMPDLNLIQGSVQGGAWETVLHVDAKIIPAHIDVDFASDRVTLKTSGSGIGSILFERYSGGYEPLGAPPASFQHVTRSGIPDNRTQTVAQIDGLQNLTATWDDNGLALAVELAESTPFWGWVSLREAPAVGVDMLIVVEDLPTVFSFGRHGGNVTWAGSEVVDRLRVNALFTRGIGNHTRLGLDVQGLPTGAGIVYDLASGTLAWEGSDVLPHLRVSLDVTEPVYIEDGLGNVIVLPTKVLCMYLAIDGLPEQVDVDWPTTANEFTYEASAPIDRAEAYLYRTPPAEPPTYMWLAVDKVPTFARVAFQNDTTDVTTTGTIDEISLVASSFAGYWWLPGEVAVQYEIPTEHSQFVHIVGLSSTRIVASPGAFEMETFHPAAFRVYVREGEELTVVDVSNIPSWFQIRTGLIAPGSLDDIALPCIDPEACERFIRYNADQQIDLVEVYMERPWAPDDDEPIQNPGIEPHTFTRILLKDLPTTVLAAWDDGHARLATSTGIPETTIVVWSPDLYVRVAIEDLPELVDLKWGFSDAGGEFLYEASDELTAMAIELAGGIDWRNAVNVLLLGVPTDLHARWVLPGEVFLKATNGEEPAAIDMLHIQATTDGVFADKPGDHVYVTHRGELETPASRVSVQISGLIGVAFARDEAGKIEFGLDSLGLPVLPVFVQLRTIADEHKGAADAEKHYQLVHLDGTVQDLPPTVSFEVLDGYVGWENTAQSGLQLDVAVGSEFRLLNEKALANPPVYQDGASVVVRDGTLRVLLDVTHLPVAGSFSDHHAAWRGWDVLPDLGCLTVNVDAEVEETVLAAFADYCNLPTDLFGLSFGTKEYVLEPTDDFGAEQYVKEVTLGYGAGGESGPIDVVVETPDTRAIAQLPKVPTSFDLKLKSTVGNDVTDLYHGDQFYYIIDQREKSRIEYSASTIVDEAHVQVWNEGKAGGPDLKIDLNQIPTSLTTQVEKEHQQYFGDVPKVLPEIYYDNDIVDLFSIEYEAEGEGQDGLDVRIEVGPDLYKEEPDESMVIEMIDVGHDTSFVTGQERHTVITSDPMIGHLEMKAPQSLIMNDSEATLQGVTGGFLAMISWILGPFKPLLPRVVVLVDSDGTVSIHTTVIADRLSSVEMTKEAPLMKLANNDYDLFAVLLDDAYLDGTMSLFADVNINGGNYVEISASMKDQDLLFVVPQFELDELEKNGLDTPYTDNIWVSPSYVRTWEGGFQVTKEDDDLALDQIVCLMPYGTEVVELELRRLCHIAAMGEWGDLSLT